MSDVSPQIAKTKEIRELASQEVEKVFRQAALPLSEQQFAHLLGQHFRDNIELYESGWYNPPPGGISALFAPANNPGRLLYDSLRKPEFWPRQDCHFAQDSIGLIYCSPLDREGGATGDFGLTVYNGGDLKIQNHIKKCLAVMETVAEATQVGLEFRQLYTYAQVLFKDNGLTNARTVSVTDPAGTSIGHTVPFTDTPLQDHEHSIIHSQNFEEVKDLVSENRIFINPAQEYKIHENGAFTVEARLEDANDRRLPNAFFHLLVTFENGRKTIRENFHYIFEALGMEQWIKSKY